MIGGLSENKMSTKRTKIEDKWWKMREDLHKVESQMRNQAIKLAERADLPKTTIGKTPLDWFYFIRQMRGETSKAIPKVRKTVSKGKKNNVEKDDRSLEAWSELILGR